MKVHNKKMTYIKKYVTRSISSTITVLNSWTRVENRLISGLQYVLLLRVSCFLQSNHHGCHQATAFSSANAPAGCSDKTSSNQKIESAGGRWEEGRASLPLFLLPILPRAFNFSLSPGSIRHKEASAKSNGYNQRYTKKRKQCILGVARGAWRVVRGAWSVIRAVFNSNFLECLQPDINLMMLMR